MYICEQTSTYVYMYAYMYVYIYMYDLCIYTHRNPYMRVYINHILLHVVTCYSLPPFTKLSPNTENRLAQQILNTSLNGANTGSCIYTPSKTKYGHPSLGVSGTRDWDDSSQPAYKKPRNLPRDPDYRLYGPSRSNLEVPFRPRKVIEPVRVLYASTYEP